MKKDPRLAKRSADTLFATSIRKFFISFRSLIISIPLLVAPLLTQIVFLPGSASADTDCSGTSVWQAGSGWLNGGGVNVCQDPGDGTNVTINGINSGTKWQCVELVNRFYIIKGWIGSHWTGDGNTLKDNLPSNLTYESNGSISKVLAGDVVTFYSQYNSAGHAAVVSSVDGDGTLHIVNQNSGSSTLVWSTATISSGSFSASNASYTSSWSGFTVQGIVHHPPLGAYGAAITATQGSGVGNAGFLNSSDHLSSGGSGASFSTNQYILSTDGRYAAVFQSDGNFVVYGPTYTYTWYSGTQNQGATKATVQSDGNFVIYNNNTPLWSSNTSGHGNSTLTIQNDGNLVLTDSNGTAFWSISYSNSNSAGTYLGTYQLTSNQTISPGQYLQSTDKRFVMIMQNDGDVVIYGPGYHALWHSGTANMSVGYMKMQSDGNLVQYGTGSLGAIWASYTGWAGLSTLKMQTDGNLVVYGPLQATWSSQAATPSYSTP